jgi:hypothetical protein
MKSKTLVLVLLALGLAVAVASCFFDVGYDAKHHLELRIGTNHGATNDVPKSENQKR